MSQETGLIGNAAKEMFSTSIAGRGIMKADRFGEGIIKTEITASRITNANTAANSIEKAAQSIFALCAFTAVFAAAAVTIYMIANGVPAFGQVGIKEILFSSQWKPTADVPSFGILNIVLTSIMGTFMAVLLGVPVAVLTAVFLAEVAPASLAAVVRPAVEMLAGIPSVVYGLLGVMVLNPFVYKLELRVFRGSETHQFTGGANLLSAVLVLSVMIMPTVINISEAAIKAVPEQLKDASLALGASRMQTIFQVILPAAKPGIMTAVVLGVGRAVGEAMAISLVSGGSVNMPFPFCSVRFLTTAIVSEMGYAGGLHRQVLFSIGLVLFLFIIMINLILSRILKRGDSCNG